MKEYSPFTPGVPVPLEFFVGRVSELQEIVQHAGKSASRNSLERVFVSGDRGIGKSSLCKMAITRPTAQSTLNPKYWTLSGATVTEKF